MKYDKAVLVVGLLGALLAGCGTTDCTPSQCAGDSSKPAPAAASQCAGDSSKPAPAGASQSASASSKPAPAAASQCAGDSSKPAPAVSPKIPKKENPSKKVDVQELAKKLLQETKADVSSNNYTRARNRINKYPVTGEKEADRPLLAFRIGLMNCLINPKECEYTIGKMKADAERICGQNPTEETLRAAIDCVMKLDVIRRDKYDDVFNAFKEVDTALRALDGFEDRRAAYVRKWNLKIKDLLDRRSGSWKDLVKYDYNGVREAIDELGKTLSHHYNDEKLLDALTKKMKEEAEDITRPAFGEMTTFEMNICMDKEKSDYLKDLNARLLRVLVNDAQKAAEARRRAAQQATKERLQAAQQAAKERLQAALRAEERARAQFRKMVKMMDDELNLESLIALFESEFEDERRRAVLEKTKLGALLAESARAVRLLRDDIARRNYSTDCSNALLLSGAYFGRVDVARWAYYLGEEDVNVSHEADPLRRTALMIALENRHNEMIKKLVDNGASAAVKDKLGRIPLCYAIFGGDVNTVSALIGISDLASKDVFARTPVFEAVKSNRPDILPVLLDHGANVNVQDKNNWTPFAYACSVGAARVLPVLGKAGAKYDGRDLLLAVENRKLSVVEWLVEKGVSVNSPGVMAAARKKAAARKENCEILDYLLKRGGQ